MLQLLIGLLIGLILGWVVEWVLDWRFWRSDVDAYDGEASGLHEQLRAAQSEISRLRSQLGYAPQAEAESGPGGNIVATERDPHSTSDPDGDVSVYVAGTVADNTTDEREGAQG